MRKAEQDIFSVFEPGFMLAYCARRVDGRRCPNKPFCQNSTKCTGRDPTSLQRAHDIHANLMQHVTNVKKGLVEFDWETAEDHVGELMTLKLCVKHQDCCDLTVECAMKLLQNECQRRVAVKQFSAPKQPTTNLQYRMNTPTPQGQHTTSQVLLSSFTQTPATPASSATNATSNQGSLPSHLASTSLKHNADAYHATVASLPEGKGAVKPDVHEVVSQSPHVSTRPITPVSNAQSTHGETKPSSVDKAKHLFATYPREETRKSVLDQLLENFETMRIRMDKLEVENHELREGYNSLKDEHDKLRARCKRLEEENDQLQERCGRLEAENKQLLARCERLEEENDQLQDRCESLTDENAKLNRQLKKLQHHEKEKLQACGKNLDGNE